jgi:hypothetical protein
MTKIPERIRPETKSPGESPKTDRAASWWGPAAGRYHWKSGGVLASDGRAVAGMPGRPLVSTVESRATRTHDEKSHIEDEGFMSHAVSSPGSWVGFVSGLRGFEHSSYAAGVAWIGRHHGELVASRPATNGGTIETYRLRFPDRDLLVTWGRGAAFDRRSGPLPEGWQVVHDRAAA